MIGIPGMVVGKTESLIENGRINLDHHQMPDPVAQVLRHMLTLIDDVNERVDSFHADDKCDNAKDSQLNKEMCKEHQKVEDFLGGDGI